MSLVQNQLDEDFIGGGYVIHFNCEHKRNGIAIDKLIQCFQNIPRNSNTSLYILHDKKHGNLFAFFEHIKDYEYRKKIIRVLNSKVKLSRANYRLEILDVIHTKKYPTFHHWLYDCLAKNNMWNLTCWVDRDRDVKDDEPDIQEIFCNLNYIAKFINSNHFRNISADYEHKNRMLEIQKKIQIEKEEHTEKMKSITKQLLKKMINKHFDFTEQGCLSKKVVCDLLNLDYKSKKDIRDLNIIFTDYGVSYDRKKMRNRECGIFIGISIRH